MCVIVPVTERSMSPSMRETPRAPPGWRSGSGAGGLPIAPAPITGVNPRPEKTPFAHSKAEGSKPENTRGRLSGRSDSAARAGGGGARRVGARVLDHFADRRDPADRLLGEREAVGDGPDELAVDEDRAAAHPGDDARLLQGAAVEAGQDQALLRSDVLEGAD